MFACLTEQLLHIFWKKDLVEDDASLSGSGFVKSADVLLYRRIGSKFDGFMNATTWRLSQFRTQNYTVCGKFSAATYFFFFLNDLHSLILSASNGSFLIYSGD